MAKNIFIGVAWPYASGQTHIGNVTGSFFPADVLFRFHRLLGDKVLMVSGSDCYGTPITVKAEEEGIEPRDVAEKYHKLNLETLQKLNISVVGSDEFKGLEPFSVGLFTKTNTDNHQIVVQKMFLKLLANGFITRQKSKQFYDSIQNKFMQDRYIEGTCPFCKYEKARGDQCENCGKVLEPKQLINPRSKNSGGELIEKETEHYYIDLEKLSPQVQKYLESPGFVSNNAPWVQKEALGWVKEGLKPRAITRDMDYGIALPVEDISEDMRISDIDKKVFYVWFEAVIGYLSASFEYSKLLGDDLEYRDDKNGEADNLLPTTRTINEFFYNKETKSYYVVGQDNIVFHAINWPAQLIAYNTDIHLPDTVQAQKFLQLEGKKLSKSNNWYIPWEDLFDNFEVDAIRFYLAYNLPESNQSNWQWDEFKNAVNGELSAKIGNFIHRVLTYTKKNFGDKLENTYKVEVQALLEKTFDDAKKAIIENKSIREYIQVVLKLAREANLYVDNNKFWELSKTDEARCQEVLYNCLNIVNVFGLLLWPICPKASDKIDAYLGLSSFGPELGKDLLKYEAIPENYKLADDITPLFAKIEDETIEAMKAKLES